MEIYDITSLQQLRSYGDWGSRGTYIQPLVYKVSALSTAPQRLLREGKEPIIFDGLYINFKVTEGQKNIWGKMKELINFGDLGPLFKVARDHRYLVRTICAE